MQGAFVYFVKSKRVKRQEERGELKNNANFYDQLSCGLAISDGKNKIKSANFTNFCPRMPLFSEYYEKFIKIYFLD